MERDVNGTSIRAIVFAVAFLAAACSPTSDGPPDYQVDKGLTAQINSDGQVFSMEVTRVDGPVATVVTRWEDQFVSERHFYRGLYAVAGSDRRTSFENSVDKTALDSLFPLDVGKEATIRGTYRVVRDRIVEGETYTVIAVRDLERMETKDAEHEVYVLDITTELTLLGRTTQYTKTVWYSPELGLVLKTVLSDGRLNFHSRVLSIERPENNPDNRRRTGTVMI